MKFESTATEDQTKFKIQFSHSPKFSSSLDLLTSRFKMLKKLFNAFKAPPPMSPHIKVVENATGSGGCIVLDRPEALNAINCEMYKTLYYVLSKMESSKSHVIVKGAGEKAFSAGGDIKGVTGSTIETCKDIFKYQLMNFDLVASYKKPYIAIMNGITMGGASPFSIAGKYRIATERTLYAMPETAIGFFNDAGASYFLPRLNFNIGMYMGMTGARLKGFDVKKVGLASHFIESSRLGDLEKALLACKTDDEIVSILTKYSSVPSPNETELDAITARVDKCFDGETVEEIYENLHLDGSDWAMNTIRTLNKMSPTSLKVTHKSMSSGKKIPLQDCLKMEFRLAINHCIKSDLREGVRALLVDKDLKPKWDPPSLQTVTEDHVDHFFRPLPDGDEVTFEQRH